MKKIRSYVPVLLVLIIIGLYRTDLTVTELKARYTDANSGFMNLDGMDVHYRLEGNPTDSVPLVLIHGTGAMLQTWDGWVNALRDSRRIVRLDLPGYGLTGPQPQNEASIQYYTRFMALFIERLGFKRCDVAGNSLGGNIAWHMALMGPDRVRQLILIDAAGYPFTSKSVPIGFRLARVPLIGGLVAKLTPDALFRSSLENVYFNDALVTDSLVQRYADLNRREGNRQAFVRRQPALDSLWQRIGQIRQPTLILWGQHDNLIPVDVAQRFHHDLPNNTLIIYPQAGHIPMEELPAQTVADYRNWSVRQSGR